MFCLDLLIRKHENLNNYETREQCLKEKETVLLEYFLKYFYFPYFFIVEQKLFLIETTITLLFYGVKVESHDMAEDDYIYMVSLVTSGITMLIHVYGNVWLTNHTICTRKLPKSDRYSGALPYRVVLSLY